MSESISELFRTQTNKMLEEEGIKHADEKPVDIEGVVFGLGFTEESAEENGIPKLIEDVVRSMREFIHIIYPKEMTQESHYIYFELEPNVYHDFLTNNYECRCAFAVFGKDKVQ